MSKVQLRVETRNAIHKQGEVLCIFSFPDDGIIMGIDRYEMLQKADDPEDFLEGTIHNLQCMLWELRKWKEEKSDHE